MANYLRGVRSLIKGLTPAEDRLLRMVSKSGKNIPTHSAAGIALAKRFNWNLANNPKYAELGLSKAKVPTRVTGRAASYHIAPTNHMNRKAHGKPLVIVRSVPQDEVEVLGFIDPRTGKWTSNNKSSIRVPEENIEFSHHSSRSNPRYDQALFDLQLYLKQPHFNLFENDWLDDLIPLYDAATAGMLGTMFI